MSNKTRSTKSTAPPSSSAPSASALVASGPSAPLVPDMSLEEMVKHIYVTVNEIKVTLSDQQQRITKLESTVTSLSQEVHSLKIIVNSHEQSMRSATIRINGFPFTTEEKLNRDSNALKARVFSQIVNPILTVAASRGLLDAPPTSNSTISSCYRVGAPSAKPDTAAPPPLVVKLTSPQLKIDLMRCKREAKVGPSDQEKALGLKRFWISEDLTQPAFKKLKELQNCVQIEKAWSVDGRLNFMLPGSNVIHRVSSVFDDLLVILDKAKS